MLLVQFQGDHFRYKARAMISRALNLWVSQTIKINASAAAASTAAAAANEDDNA